MSTNALISIHAAMDHVKISRDHMNAFVQLDISLIQVGKFAVVSLCIQ